MPSECVAEDPAHGESQKRRAGRALVKSKRKAGQGVGFSEPHGGGGGGCGGADLLAAAAGDPCRVVLERDHRLLGFVLELEGLDLSAACLGSEVRACASQAPELAIELDADNRVRHCSYGMMIGTQVN